MKALPWWWTVCCVGTYAYVILSLNNCPLVVEAQDGGFMMERGNQWTQERKRHQREEKKKSTEQDQTHGFTSEILNRSFPKPRGIVEGTLNAVRDALLGAIIVPSSFIGLPVLGYLQGGLIGLIFGGFGGVLSATLILIATLGSAIYDFSLGVAQIPASIDAFFSGKTWNEEQREWIHYSLEAETAELDQRQSESVKTTKHFTLYDTLGVNPNATSQEIKKKYRQLAKELHPDKNPGDKNAQAEFLKLFEAYSTLSDAKLRAEYDRHGKKSSTDAAGEFDAKVFFAVLLDADSVEPYVGQLSVSNWVTKAQQFVILSEKSSDAINNEAMDLFMQGWKDDARRRYVDIANHFVVFMKDYENPESGMTDQEFTAKSELEAKTILETAFGNKFLNIIGKVLVREANKRTEVTSPMSFPSSLATTIVEFWDRNQLRFEMANKAYLIFKEGKISQENFFESETFQGVLLDFVDLAWAFVESDISSTLHAVCERMMNDSIGGIQRRRRTKGLRLFGQTMLSLQQDGTCLVDAEPSLHSMKERAIRAYEMATMTMG